ncbi:MAG: hypothetical protein LKG11_04260 [Bacilli bacterium]|jgi:hypothetical protein|nr:hypothetical protein [Bacilli bacterium]
MDQKEKEPKLRFAQRFARMDPIKKDFVLLAAFYGIVFVLLIPLFFFRLSMWNWGWLAGALVSLFSYWSISKLPDMLMGQTPSGMTVKSVLFMSARMLLYIAVLVVSAICTFKPEWFGGWDLLSFWSTMLAIVPMPFVLILSNLHGEKGQSEIHTLCPTDEETKGDSSEGKAE